VAIWAHALIGFGGPGMQDFFGRWMHDAVILAAAAGCLAGAARGGADRFAWGVLAVGLLSTAAGDLIYSAAPDLDAVPVPSISDPFWLALYPCEYLALLALIRSRVGRTLWATRLDGLAGGLAAASMVACVTVSAAAHGSAGAPFWEAATNLAYPVGDLILLGAIVSAVGLAGWRIDRLWATLAVAIVAMETADLMYMSGVEGALGDVADAFVATGMVGLAWAAALAPGARGRGRATTGRGLFVPVGFGVLALGVLALGVPLHFNAVALGLAVAALGLVLVRMALALGENHTLLAASRVEATTDALTGLSNRRKLELDLATALHDDSSRALVLLDLNGFKTYNDSYGHVAGDMLLTQLGTALARAVDGRGTAYRMGGDEFCVLAPLRSDLDELSRFCAAALATHGDGFAITAAYGGALLPDEGRDVSTVLALADARMYGHKHAGRPPAAHQSAGVLMAVVAERAPGLASHVNAVCELACAAAEELGVIGAELEALRHAAALHDIGKMAIPDAILEKPGALSDTEWALIRRHTLIGERILAAAPALERSARLVRWSHERVDGTGYPDGLTASDIPLGSRIILVADAFDAMVTERSYGTMLSEADALTELRRCAGTQFDPSVVAAFERVIARRQQLAPQQS
jgi:diguanylate cyclase (GGDEF)-like protein/putative nucleotidyltransferase with HDIG domain